MFAARNRVFACCYYYVASMRTISKITAYSTDTTTTMGATKRATATSLSNKRKRSPLSSIDGNTAEKLTSASTWCASVKSTSMTSSTTTVILAMTKRTTALPDPAITKPKPKPKLKPKQKRQHQYRLWLQTRMAKLERRKRRPTWQQS